MEVEEPVVNQTTYENNFTNEGGVCGRYDLLKNIMGMWIIQQLRADWDRAGESFSFSQMVELAQAAEPFKCFIDPDDESFVAPVGMGERIQAYCKRTGQAVPESKGELIRCVYESLALKYRQAVDGLEEITGKKIGTLHIVGGGCQNKMLNAMTANAIGRRVVTGPVEGTAAGNLLLQALAKGSIGDIEQLRGIVAASFESEEYMPQDTALWNEAYNATKG